MRYKILILCVLTVFGLMTCQWWQNRKAIKPEPVFESDETASHIFEQQNKVYECAKHLHVDAAEIDVPKEEFATDIAEACTNEELTKISRYWYCFANQLTCPLTWSAPYRSAGESCMPLPKLSSKCCTYYSIEWTGNKGTRHTSCRN